jgi:anti-anti-sigma factor
MLLPEGVLSIPHSNVQGKPPMMNIQHPKPEEILVTFDTNPDSSESTAWTDEIRAALTGQEKTATVDLKALPFLSSLGVNVIVSLHNMLKKQDGRVTVLVPNAKMSHVFDLFQLRQLMDVQMIQPS